MVKRAYVFIGFLFCLSLSMNVLWAQDTTFVDIIEIQGDSKIRWINQIPPVQEDIVNPKKGWLKRLILGKKEKQTLKNPVFAIGYRHENAIILDQGNGIILHADEGDLIIPNVIRKKKLVYPSMVAACLLPTKELLFTDSKLNTIYVYSEENNRILALNERLELNQPTGIAYSKIKDHIWVVETKAHRITVLDRLGNPIKTIGARGNGPGEFNYPTHIWIDKEGTAYVVDALNYRVQIFDFDGNFLSMFGENGDGTGFMARPKGIAVDSLGHIYVVDALFHGVQIFDREGNYLHQFGNQGSRTSEFWMPNGIYIDDDDHIFVADSYNSRIQIFELIYKE